MINFRCHYCDTLVNAQAIQRNEVFCTVRPSNEFKPTARVYCEHCVKDQREEEDIVDNQFVSLTKSNEILVSTNAQLVELVGKLAELTMRNVERDAMAYAEKLAAAKVACPNADLSEEASFLDNVCDRIRGRG